MTATSVPPASFVPTRASALVVVHEDAHCLVLDKPAGLLAVPGRGADKQDCLASRAQARWPDAQVVHRLDMATSGLLLMARGPAMQRAFSAAFAERRVDKRYVAVVAGRLLPSQPDGEGWSSIALPLSANWPQRPRQQVDLLQGKPSLTRWRVLSHDQAQGTTRLELAPVTGRTHQLRVHLMALGHPIVGDALYAPAEVAAQSPRLLLHAWRLHTVHPATGGMLTLQSAPGF